MAGERNFNRKIVEKRIKELRERYTGTRKKEELEKINKNRAILGLKKLNFMKEVINRLKVNDIPERTFRILKSKLPIEEKEREVNKLLLSDLYVTGVWLRNLPLREQAVMLKVLKKYVYQFLEKKNLIAIDKETGIKYVVPPIPKEPEAKGTEEQKEIDKMKRKLKRDFAKEELKKRQEEKIKEIKNSLEEYKQIFDEMINLGLENDGGKEANINLWENKLKGLNSEELEKLEKEIEDRKIYLNKFKTTVEKTFKELVKINAPEEILKDIGNETIKENELVKKIKSDLNNFIDYDLIEKLKLDNQGISAVVDILKDKIVKEMQDKNMIAVDKKINKIIIPSNRKVKKPKSTPEVKPKEEVLEKDIRKHIKELGNENIDEGIKAVEALVKLGAPAVSEIIPVLDDKSEIVRRNAIWAFGELAIENPGNKDILKVGTPKLIKALEDKDKTVSRNAVWALEKIAEVNPKEKGLVKSINSALEEYKKRNQKEQEPASNEEEPKTVEELLSRVEDSKKKNLLNQYLEQFDNLVELGLEYEENRVDKLKAWVGVSTTNPTNFLRLCKDAIKETKQTIKEYNKSIKKVSEKISKNKVHEDIYKDILQTKKNTFTNEKFLQKVNDNLKENPLVTKSISKLRPNEKLMLRRKISEEIIATMKNENLIDVDSKTQEITVIQPEKKPEVKKENQKEQKSVPDEKIPEEEVSEKDNIHKLIEDLGDLNKSEKAILRLIEIGVPVVPELIKALGDKNSDVITNASEVLVEIGAPAVPELIEALDNENENVRANAVFVLATIVEDNSGNEIILNEGVPALIKAFGDKNEDVRESARMGLIEIGVPVVPELIKALKTENEIVRRNAVFGLATIAEDNPGNEMILNEGVPALINALGDENEDVRKNAIWAFEVIVEANPDKEKVLNKVIRESIKNLGNKKAKYLQKSIVKALKEQTKPENKEVLEIINSALEKNLKNKVKAKLEKKLKKPLDSFISDYSELYKEMFELGLADSRANNKKINDWHQFLEKSPVEFSNIIKKEIKSMRAKIKEYKKYIERASNLQDKNDIESKIIEIIKEQPLTERELINKIITRLKENQPVMKYIENLNLNREEKNNLLKQISKQAYKIVLDNHAILTNSEDRKLYYVEPKSAPKKEEPKTGSEEKQKKGFFSRLFGGKTTKEKFLDEIDKFPKDLREKILHRIKEKGTEPELFENVTDNGIIELEKEPRKNSYFIPAGPLNEKIPIVKGQTYLLKRKRFGIFIKNLTTNEPQKEIQIKNIDDPRRISHEQALFKLTKDGLEVWEFGKNKLKELREDALKKQEPVSDEDKQKEKVDEKSEEEESASEKKISKLIDKFEDEDYAVRENAYKELVKLGASAVPEIIKALNNKNENVRKIAVGSLGEITKANIRNKNILKMVVPEIIKTLGDKSEKVLKNAFLALIDIGVPAVPELIKALENENENMHENAKWALVGIGAPAVPALINTLGDENEDVRESAAWGLATIAEDNPKDEKLVNQINAALEKYKKENKV